MDVPVPNFCPTQALPDAGVQDATTLDADSPPIPDAGPRPGAPCTDGVAGQCVSGETCYEGYCRRHCDSNFDCGALWLGCFEPGGVCICRYSCDTNIQCGPFMCVDRCCQFE
jgi:hypothetical protein